jgi:hypothetical protein
VIGLSSSLLSKNVEVRIYKIIILPVVLYEGEILSVTFRQEGRFSVFEKRDEATGG